jgi:hypothetical protein
MISSANGSRMTKQSRRLRAERRRYVQLISARVLLHAAIRPHQSKVRSMLTLMFVLVRSASLSLEFGANLLEKLRQTSARRRLPRRAHTAMRVIHDCSWMVRLACRNVFCCLQWLLKVYQVGGLRSRWRCASALSLVAKAAEG